MQGGADSAVPWWSFGKTVLASAALALVSAGRLALDEPVRDRPFTLRHLLQHRAGLRCYGGVRAYHEAVAAGGPAWPVDELLRRCDAETLAYPPGQGWGYSNIGYLLVRQMIEAAADAPLGPALERLVFGPLAVPGVRVLTAMDPAVPGVAPRYDPSWVYHGLLVGTAGAAALLLDRLLAGDLVSPGLVAEMRRGHAVDGAIPGRPWRTASYGLGLMIGQGQPAGEYTGHTGGGPGSVFAAYQCAGPAPCTAAAFAAEDDPGIVEARAMQLAAGMLAMDASPSARNASQD